MLSKRWITIFGKKIAFFYRYFFLKLGEGKTVALFI